MVEVTLLGRRINVTKATDTGMGYIICEYQDGTCVLSDLSAADQSKVRAQGISLSAYAQMKQANASNPATSTGQQAAASAPATAPRDMPAGPEYPGKYRRDFMTPQYRVVFPNSLSQETWYFIEGHGIINSQGVYTTVAGSYTTKAQLPAGTTLGGVVLGGAVPNAGLSFPTGTVRAAVEPVQPVVAAVIDPLKALGGATTGLFGNISTVIGNIGTGKNITGAVDAATHVAGDAITAFTGAVRTGASAGATLVTTGVNTGAKVIGTAAGTGAAAAVTGFLTPQAGAGSPTGTAVPAKQGPLTKLANDSAKAAAFVAALPIWLVIGIACVAVVAAVVIYDALKGKRRSSYGRY